MALPDYWYGKTTDCCGIHIHLGDSCVREDVMGHLLGTFQASYRLVRLSVALIRLCSVRLGLSCFNTTLTSCFGIFTCTWTCLILRPQPSTLLDVLLPSTWHNFTCFDSFTYRGTDLVWLSDLVYHLSLYFQILILRPWSALENLEQVL